MAGKKAAATEQNEKDLPGDCPNIFHIVATMVSGPSCPKPGRCDSLTDLPDGAVMQSCRSICKRKNLCPEWCNP
jgi:hypothetical protein